MSGPYAPFKTPRPATSLNGGKGYKDRTSSVLSPAPAADWRTSSQQPASIPSSSFHGAPSGSSQGGARRGASSGAGGDGFDSLLDTYGFSIGGPSSSSSSTMRPARPPHAAFEQRPRPAPRRLAQPPVVQRSDEREQAARAAEQRRKQAQEDAEGDVEATQRQYEEADRLEQLRRAAIAAAKKKPPAPAVEPPKPRLMTSVDLAFADQKGRPKPKGKDKGEEARERAKERRARGKDKGKGKNKQRLELESDTEDSPDDRSPRRKSSSSSSSVRKLGSLRGQFDTAPPPAASPSPSPEVVAEVLPTLKDMLDEERTAERKRLKGKGRALDVEEDEHAVERDEMDMERSLREETDALLDVADDAIPDASTLCPFCDRPLPDTPSPQLLATRAALLRLPHGPRPSLRNKAAVRLPEGEHVVRTAAFCKMHVDEREVVPDGRARGYPTRIQWDELPRRINRQLDTHLSDVILGKATSPFLDRARNAWEAGEWKSVLSEYGSFDVEEPGYYGPRGLELMKHTLSRLFVEEMALITPRRIAPLSIDFYLRRVLVPECAVELIRADLASSAAPPARRDGEMLRAQAERVRVESRAYGRAVFPHEAEAEERREAAAARAPAPVAGSSGAAATVGAQGKKGGRDRDELEGEHEREEARPAKKRKRASSSSSSSSSASSDESDGIEVVERARAPAPARTPKVVTAPPVRAPTTGGGFRVPKAQGQARSAAPSTSSSAPAGAAAATASATGGRQGVATQDDSDSDDELVIVSTLPLASSPGKKVKKDKKKEKEKGRKHKDQDCDQDRQKHKKVRRSSPASSPALGLFPPSSSRPSSSLALDSSPHTRQTDYYRLTAALDPAADDELAEVEFTAGSFARENRRREAREKKERREKKKRERARKKVRGGRASSSSSSDEA